MTLIARCIAGASLLFILIPWAVADDRVFNANVEDIDSHPVPNQDVRIEGLGSYRTSDSGEFSFPDAKVFEEHPILFKVSNWVVTSPCVSQNGRTFRPPLGEVIQIRVVRRKDPRLLQLRPALASALGCTVEEAVSTFDVSIKPAEAEFLRDNQNPVVSGGIARQDVRYSSADYGFKRGLNSDMTVAESQPSSSQDEFLARKAQEFGFSKDELASAISSWLAMPQVGYEQGLAQLYSGHFVAAEQALQASIASAPDSDNVVQRFIPLARAKYENGEIEAAEADLNRVLKLRPTDSLARKDLETISPKPRAPTNLRATIEQ